MYATDTLEYMYMYLHAYLSMYKTVICTGPHVWQAIVNNRVSAMNARLQHKKHSVGASALK